MAENSYITLANSDISLSKKFAVIRTGRQKMKSKKSTVRETFDGGIDVTMGGIHEIWQLIIRVRETEDRVGYGDREDLETFYDYNNPNGTPTNVISFTDHEGNAMTCYMVGNFKENLLSVKMTGTNSFYLCQIVLRIIPT